MTPPRVVATRIITDPHSGRMITAPAHLLAPPRIKQSDINRYGSFTAARDELSRRAASMRDSNTPAIEAGRGNGDAGNV